MVDIITTTYTLSPDEVRALTIHPAADLFPMLSDSEMAELGQDIHDAGLLHPITLTADRTQVIDGRNRFKACIEQGVTPVFEDWQHEGSDPVAWVLSVNLRRRHLTDSQRAMIAVDAKALIQAARMEATGTSTPQAAASKLAQAAKDNGATPHTAADGEGRRARDEAAAALGVHGSSVDRAAAVKAADPELAAEVKAGNITVNAAKDRIALGDEWKPILDGANKDAPSQARRLVREAPDLAERVLSGDMKLYAAKTELDKRQGKKTNAERRREALGQQERGAAPKASAPKDTRHPKTIADQEAAETLLSNLGHMATSLLKLDREAVLAAADKHGTVVEALAQVVDLLR
jgi:hypothetical protein